MSLHANIFLTHVDVHDMHMRTVRNERYAYELSTNSSAHSDQGLRDPILSVEFYIH